MHENGLKLSQVTAVFLTHLHGDHYYGLPGLLSTSSLQDRSAPLTVVGPAGIRAVLDGIPGVRKDDLTFSMNCVELEHYTLADAVFQGADYTVSALALDHGLPTFGYRYAEHPTPGSLDVDRARGMGVNDYAQFRALKRGEAVEGASGRRVRPEDVIGPERPGGVFAYITDTRPCEAGVALARGADIVFHDSTFGDEHTARAFETGHSTAREAAEVARAAGATRLLLGHFSARYRSLDSLLKEAQEVFPGAEAAEESRRYVLGDERLVGGPRSVTGGEE
jgi:ribonuclease Z